MRTTVQCTVQNQKRIEQPHAITGAKVDLIARKDAGVNEHSSASRPSRLPIAQSTQDNKGIPDEVAVRHLPALVATGPKKPKITRIPDSIQILTDNFLAHHINPVLVKPA
jgi:hypothetical protein